MSYPYFDSAGERNVSSFVGQTTHLNCIVKDLGDKRVSNHWVRDRAKNRANNYKIWTQILNILVEDHTITKELLTVFNVHSTHIISPVEYH